MKYEKMMGGGRLYEYMASGGKLGNEGPGDPPKSEKEKEEMAKNAEILKNTIIAKQRELRDIRRNVSRQGQFPTKEDQAKIDELQESIDKMKSEARLLKRRRSEADRGVVVMAKGGKLYGSMEEGGEVEYEGESDEYSEGGTDVSDMNPGDVFLEDGQFYQVNKAGTNAMKMNAQGLYRYLDEQGVLMTPREGRTASQTRSFAMRGISEALANNDMMLLADYVKPGYTGIRGFTPRESVEELQERTNKGRGYTDENVSKSALTRKLLDKGL